MGLLLVCKDAELISAWACACGLDEAFSPFVLALSVTLANVLKRPLIGFEPEFAVA